MVSTSVYLTSILEKSSTITRKTVHTFSCLYQGTTLPLVPTRAQILPLQPLLLLLTHQLKEPSCLTHQICKSISNIVNGEQGIHYHAISLVWLIYNAIPYFLVLQYTFGNPERRKFYCMLCFGLSFFLAISTIVVIWSLLPWPVDTEGMLGMAL